MFSAANAHAQEPARESEARFSLSWSAPEDCPNEAALRAEVVRLAPEAAGEVPGFSARGAITRRESGFGLELETIYGERHGSREMQDVSCTELTRAAAVVIALAIRPESAAPDASTISEPKNSTPTEPQKTAAEPPKSPAKAKDAATAPRTAPVASPWEIWLSGAFAGEVGTLPGFAPGALFGVEGRRGWSSFGVSAEILPTQRTNTGEPSLAVSYVGGDAFGCVALRQRRFAPGACAGIGVGRLRGESRNASIGGEGSTLWVTPRLGAFISYRMFERFSLEAGAHLRIPVKQASFTVENFGPVYETAPVAALFSLGAVVRIW